MKRIQKVIPELARRCLNPSCNRPMEGKRPHAKTCSPACRKALWRYSPTPKHLAVKKPAGRSAGKRNRSSTSTGRR